MRKRPKIILLKEVDAMASGVPASEDAPEAFHLLQVPEAGTIPLNVATEHHHNVILCPPGIAFLATMERPN